jgi:YD repeat-containing protein
MRTLTLALMIGCTGSTPVDDDGVVAEVVDEGPAENKVRPDGPKLVKHTEYKTRPDDLKGTIVMMELYNGEGLRSEIVAYDFYGSGEEDGRTKNEYNAKGELVKSDNGTMVETYTYDGEGRRLTEGWRRDKEGANTEYVYDDKGNETEARHLTPAGDLDFTRATIYVYNDAGHIVEESKFEKYTDGSADLEMYHHKLEVDDAGRITKKSSLRSDGKVTRHETMKYDRRGNEVEIATHGMSGSMNGKETTTYNEYGEFTQNQNWSCSDKGDCSANITTTFTYDEHGSELTSMTVQEHGEDMGSRHEYEYAP